MTAPKIVTPTTLANQHAELVPLTQAHCADLQIAVGDLHTLWYTWVPTPDNMAVEIERRLSLQVDGKMLPFAAIDPATGKAVGMTTYMNIDATHQRLEIGSTWTSATMQRTVFNTACKHLLLKHAFEALGCIAVELRTHRLNAQSRRAIERIGAQLDGILRNHMTLPNTVTGSYPLLRDTAVYSIIQSEWASINAHLSHQMARVL